MCHKVPDFKYPRDTIHLFYNNDEVDTFNRHAVALLPKLANDFKAIDKVSVSGKPCPAFLKKKLEKTEKPPMLKVFPC